jgi:transposase
LTLEQFEEFVLPHLHLGSRRPQPKLSLHAIFNYILKLLYLGCQWQELPIEKTQAGRPEIHYTRIYSAFRRYEAQGCFDAIFAGSVLHRYCQLNRRCSKISTVIPQSSGSLNFTQPFASKRLLATL